MIKQELKEVIKKELVGVSYVCDNCKKEEESKKIPEGWVSFMSGHDEWGNDSCDSVEYLDLCSAECYIEKLNELYNDNKDYKTFEIKGDLTILFIKKLLTLIKEL